jgi:hypothetical protein
MPSFFQQLVGSKPQVPDLPSLNLTTEQQKALASNLQQLPTAEKIAANVDLFNQQQIDQMLEHVIPNYRAITGQISQNIASLTAGEVPTDVSEALQRSTAAQALSGGYGGTESGRNLFARDLGLTSLDLTQRGLASAESWMKTANTIYKPGQFNVASMFVTPAQQAAFDTSERDSQFQRQWMQNQIAGMPAPWAEDMKQFVYRAMAAYSGTSVPSNPYSTPSGNAWGVNAGPGMDAQTLNEAGFSFGGDSNINLNFGGANADAAPAGGGGGGGGAALAFL